MPAPDGSPDAGPDRIPGPGASADSSSPNSGGSGGSVRVPDCDRPAAGRWLVLYDGDCGLCIWLLSLLLRGDRDRRLQPVALQDAGAAALLAELTPEQRLASWHLISPGGRRYSAGAALAPLLRLLPGGRLPAAACERAPALTERAYAWVAANRARLSRLVPDASKRSAAEQVRQRD